MEKLQALLIEWSDLRTETRHYMFMLDVWIIVILFFLLLLLWASRQAAYRDAIVAATLLGAVSTVWIGRIDVLIHRPVPAVVAIESDIDTLLREVNTTESTQIREIFFGGWENYYKARIKSGVKILIPLDLVAGVFLFALFMHANNAAYHGYLNETWWRGYFWWGVLVVHLFGWVIIASAKWLAE